MYFDRPGLVLLVALATIGPLAGLAIARWIGKQSDAYLIAAYFTMFVVDLFNGLVISTFLAQMYDEYKRMASGDGNKRSWTPSRPEPVKPERVLLDMNTGKPMYAFQTPAVKIDHMTRKIKHFCIVLINQREHGFKIDLREITWKAHFGGHDNYVNVRDVRLAGAFAKESSRTNSPFVVLDWRIVEDGAKGKMK